MTLFLYIVHAFVELTQDLLTVPGVEYVLSERLCQDPLEAFFGKQRAAGGRNENPTIQQFCDNTVTLRVQRSAALEPVQGNCRKRPGPVDCSALTDETPLPKRSRKAKKY